MQKGQTFLIAMDGSCGRLETAMEPGRLNVLVVGKTEILKDGPSSVRTEYARDPRTALDILRTRKFDLVAVDVSLARALFESSADQDRNSRLSNIGFLAATAAHELRTPLTTISIAIENIRRKCRDKDLEKHISVIDKKVFESNQVINNLLFYSRIKEPQLENVRIKDVIDDCVEIIAGNYPKKNVKFEKQLEEIAELSVQADPLQIREVLSNVLDNAVDAVSETSGRIGVEARLSDNKISICVRDNGKGISDGDMKCLFEPFFTTKAKGMGLGLCVCKQIMDLHGGAIDIESRLGEGTFVVVSLNAKP